MPLDTRGGGRHWGTPFEANPFHFVHGHTNASFLGPRRTHPLVKPSPAQPNVWWVCQAQARPEPHLALFGFWWLYVYLFLFFGQASQHTGILVPQLGTEPLPPLAGVWCLHHQDPRRSSCCLLALRDQQGFPSTCSVGDLGSIPESGRSPGGGHGNLLQYCCLENPTDRGAWRAVVHGVPKSQTRPSN